MSVNANDLAILKHFYGNEKGKGKKSVKTTNTSLVGTTSSLPKVSAGQGKQLVPGYVLDPYHGLDAYESDYTSSEDEYESDNEPPALYSSSPRKSRSYHRIESSQSSIRSEASTASTSAFTLDTSVDEEDDIETIATDGFLREQAGLPTRADQVKQRRKKEHREFIKCGDEEIYIWHAEGARKTLSPEEKKKRTALQRENDKMMDEFWDLADSAKRRMERKAVKLDNKKGASSAGQSKIKSSAPAKLKRRAIEYK